MISRLVSVSKLTLHWLIPWDAEQFKPHSRYWSWISCSCFRGSLLTLQPLFLQIKDLPTWALWTLGSEQFPVAVTVVCILRPLAAPPGPPDVSSTSQAVTIKNVCRCGQTSLEPSPHCWEPVNLSVPRRKLCQELTWICAVWIYVIIIYGGCTATEQRIYIKATTGVLSEKKTFLILRVINYDIHPVWLIEDLWKFN